MHLRLRLEYTRYPHMGSHAGYYQFAQYLDGARFKVSLTGTPDTDDALPFWLRPLKGPLRRRFKQSKMPWYKASNLAAELGILAQALSGGIDVVHLLDGEHSSAVVPQFLRRLHVEGVRTVATFHQPPSIARDVVDPKILKWFDRIILVSPSQLPFFAAHVPRTRLQVLLHGVDTQFFRPAPREARAGTLRCITVGHWLRDHDALKDVAGALSDQSGIVFDVVTNRALGLETFPNIRVHKNISDDALARLYRNADVLFLPLVDSTANNALLEGMASGLAVVTTDTESTRAYLPSDEAILVRDNDRRGLIQALVTLQRDAELKSELGRRARRRAEALSWPRLAGDFERLYETVCAAPAYGALLQRGAS